MFVILYIQCNKEQFDLSFIFLFGTKGKLFQGIDT